MQIEKYSGEDLKMGDILKAVHDDTEDYLDLCKEYGETPEKDELGPNPYGKHAHLLKQRKKKEREQEIQRMEKNVRKNIKKIKQKGSRSGSKRI